MWKLAIFLIYCLHHHFLKLACAFLSQREPNVTNGVYVNIEECFKPSSTRSILNHGSFETIVYHMKRISEKKEATFLFLGGSITAHYRYYTQFLDSLAKKNIKIKVHNYAHGGTGAGYTLYCESIHNLVPDVVFIDYGVNELPPSPEYESLIRKMLFLPDPPLIILVNFINASNRLCNLEPNFLGKNLNFNILFSLLIFLYFADLAIFYRVVYIDFCHILNHCIQDWKAYTRDGVHPSSEGTHSNVFYIPKSSMLTYLYFYLKRTSDHFASTRKRLELS